jgi:tetrahydromethanopterin S-methyltransferase subunit F
MRAAIYDLSMLVGSGLIVAGVALLFGLAASLIVAGVLMMIVTRLAVGIA